MGIRGLTAWLKKKHPASLQSLPFRWGTPGITGKRVAIDATLVTNRFHFAVQDGPLQDKSAILGWYNMITSMRLRGMKPFAVWDERGVRDWKAPEAKKRLATRTLNLFRLRHEDIRAERLARLRTAVETVGLLTEAERTVIKTQWEETKFVAAQPMAGSIPSTVSPILDKLGQIQDNFRAHNKPFARPLRDPAVDLSAQLDSVTVGENTAHEELRDAVETAALDYAIEDTPSPYVESPLQTALTGAEGEIVSRYFSEEILSGPAGTLKEIDELLEEAPSIKAIYERALAVPTVETHEECQELMRVMGVPVIEAKIPYEAEGVAASMALNGLADFVGTEDSDVLAYQAPLLRNLSSVRKPLELIDGGKLPEVLGLTSAQYLDFVVLLGTDASPRIPGFGPVRAYDAIKAHGSIEAVVANDPKAAAAVGAHPEAFFNLVKNSRDVFCVAPPPPSPEQLVEGTWSKDAVHKYLRERHGIFIRQDSPMLDGDWETLAEMAELNDPADLDELIAWENAHGERH